MRQRVTPVVFPLEVHVHVSCAAVLTGLELESGPGPRGAAGIQRGRASQPGAQCVWASDWELERKHPMSRSRMLYSPGNCFSDT